jgi:hypothetical protein
MRRDPFEFVTDAPLFVVPRMLAQLRGYREGAKLVDLAGPAPSAKRERLADELDRLADRLIAGIEAHPTRFWVLKQFQRPLETLEEEDSEARAHVGTELERLMAILGIARSDWVLSCYLGEFRKQQRA